MYNLAIYTFLPSAVTLRTHRYCFLVYSVLGEGVSYALAMPMSREPVLHFPVALRTQRHGFLSYSVLRELVSYAIHWGTGYYTYQWPCIPGDIFCWFIRSWERLLAMPMPREPVLHLPVALGTRRYCLLVYSVLGEGIRYGLAMPWPCLCLGNRSCTYQWPCVPSDIVS